MQDSTIRPAAVDRVITTAQAERFWTKVDVRSDDECWQWLGYITVKGYGSFGIGTKRTGFGMAPAYRVAYRLAVGPVPAGLHLDHLCRNRWCVNPRHVEPVTQRVNNLRGQSIQALNARKTHCLRGHPLTGDNLRLTRDGRRVCRTCVRADSLRRYHRSKTAG